MKQKTTKLALMFLVAVVAFTSCSKSSKTARFLPDDAITMRIDVKQILDKSKAADNDAVKQQLAKNLEAMGKNEEAKAVLKAVAEDPAKAGIDLRQPLWVSTNAEGKNALLVGELLDNYLLAEDVYKVTSDRYREGIASMTEVLQDEMSMSDAQNNYLTAHFNYQVSNLTLLKLTGQLEKLLK